MAKTDATDVRLTAVASSPHIYDQAFSTRRIMVDVLIGLAFPMVMAIVVFRWFAVVQVGLCVLTCLAAESAIARLRGQKNPIGDFSVAITGVILGLSLPWSAPWYVPVIGSVVAVSLGKMVFGGLGFNIFNPAMVGRAFVMLSFASAMGASAYMNAESKQLTVVTQATPLTAAKKMATKVLSGEITTDQAQEQTEASRRLWPLFVGNVNGSLGETSALAALVGGLFLCLRRSAAWEIPLAVLLGVFCSAAAAGWLGLTPLTPLEHLLSGTIVFGAFFIATDPVTSPMTFKGKVVFGLVVGFVVIMIRLFSGYPEGFMFAILLGNGIVPLLNRWTIPRPVGGPVPVRA